MKRSTNQGHRAARVEQLFSRPGRSEKGSLRLACCGVMLALMMSVGGSGCVRSAPQLSSTTAETADSHTVSDFTPAKPQRWKMPNGLEIIYLRDDELPLIKGKLLLRGGSLWADGYPLGTTSAMGELMRTGGAGRLSADALDKELEKLAAGISSSFSSEFGGVSFSCLEHDVDRVFEMFADVVMRPRFEAERLSLWRGQALEGIRRRIEDPATVATIAFTQLVYGDTPYGRVSRSKDIAAVNRPHLVDLHRHLVRPDGALLVITGKIDQPKVEELAERFFAEWQPRGQPLPAAPQVDHQPKAGVYFISLPFAQSSVKFGQLGVPRFTPDYPAIDVFNEVFGSGGFGSRLMKKVRTELGLSYGVYGGISAARVRGVNYVFVQTKAESTGQAISASIAELKVLQKEQASVEELSEKKLAISNSFVFNFSSRDEIAGRMATQELLGYPAGYDATYLKTIDSVTPGDVQSVARSRWNPAEFVIVVVGNEVAYRAMEQERSRPGSELAEFDLIKLGFGEAIQPAS